MKQVKVMTVFGTRPEAIKMAPVVKALEKESRIESIVCVTGQHKEMLDSVLDVFGVVPDVNLKIMTENQSLGEITTRALTGLEGVMKTYQPDVVLVHGDTTTTLAGALAAYYNRIRIGHVEAGLRTYNKYSPFPEEMNRQLTDRASDYCFAPTETAKKQLLDEKIDEDRVFVTGNTVIDAMAYTVNEDYWHEVFDWIGDDRLLLLTAHRRENLGEPMRRIFKAIRRIVDEFDDVKVVYPIHMNPKVRTIAKEVFDGCEKVKLIEPLDVVGFHNFENKAFLILTDSGGVQEEAPSLGKPVLVLRDTTERPEGVEAGTLKLVGTEEKEVYNATKQLLMDKDKYARMSKASNPYGDGKASERIVQIILKAFDDEAI